ncbi:DUF6444 domain-containing protein, partial [Nocardia sp. NPDC058497]|uniref:DUF6444 domain-containing protein n=1 Tax=Nocardia sp. NPDC058497 TaxID=3346529 RepID=UPI0036470627
MPDDPLPTPEELAAQLIRLSARLDTIEAEHRVVIAGKDTQITALEAEVVELKRRLRMNSQDSSKLPSSDSPFVKPAPKSLRRRSGRKPGGQAGHEGRPWRWSLIPTRSWSTNRPRVAAV